jgi:hypothetical protein
MTRSPAAQFIVASRLGRVAAIAGVVLAAVIAGPAGASGSRHDLACENLITWPNVACVSQSQSDFTHFTTYAWSGRSWTPGSYTAPQVSGPVSVDAFFPASGSHLATLAMRELGVWRALSEDPTTVVPTDLAAFSPGAILPGTEFLFGNSDQYLLPGDSTHMGLGETVGHVAVAGTGNQIDVWLPTSGSPVALGLGPNGQTLGTYSCTALYVCTTEEQTLAGQVATTAYAVSGTHALVVTKDAGWNLRVWYWDGHSLRAQPALTTYFHSIHQAGALNVTVGFAQAPGRPSVFRVGYDVGPGIGMARNSPPSDTIFLGDPNTDRWTPAYYAPSVFQSGVRRPGAATLLPWQTTASVSSTAAAVVWLGGQLAALAPEGMTGTLWTTPPGGHKWQRIEVN